MKLYADAPVRRTRQVAGDLLLALWIVAWVAFARLVHETVMLLARPGEEIESAGNGLAERLRDAGNAVDDAPLLGDRLESPFSGAGDAADKLAGAGASQVEAVEQLATWLALAVGAIPILLAVAVYVPLRWRFVREATAGQRFVDGAADLDLFALRALTNQPMHRLAQVSDDPAGAWRERDPLVVRRLALLELADLGLRPPP
ncbi:hypothetical protein [Nocardioides caldifontis]|uniref:hypothetical protein n=1 Tax=Nocardioides caldifontis TaxID=2588938 RepID=UPI0011DF53F5|nr:hypothetical protein [Nocardioides caldifontis]